MSIDDTVRTNGCHVAVLMGGPSREHEVSLQSGRAVAAALVEAGYRVSSVVFEAAALPELPADVEVVFPALHGRYGEDGELQSALAAAGLPFVGNDAASSRLTIDKHETKRVLAAAGLRVPDGVLVTDATAPLPGQLSLPLVVKPPCEGSTIGLSVVREADEWPAALAASLACDPSAAMAEAFISGSELTVGVIAGEALPIIEIVPPNGLYDYDAKYVYSKGRTQYFCPPRDLSAAQQAEIQRLAEQAYVVLGATSLLRVDVMVAAADGTPYILEVNSLPGFTGTSLLPKAAAAAGIAFPELCSRLVRDALARAGERHG